MANSRQVHLTRAKKGKNDEFYTQWSDIEKEVNAYIEFNPDVFRGKTILLPADDPFESNFFKFFATKFNEFGIKKPAKPPNKKKANVIIGLRIPY